MSGRNLHTSAAVPLAARRASPTWRSHIPAVQALKWCTEPNAQITVTEWLRRGGISGSSFTWGHSGLFSSRGPSQPCACLKTPWASPYPFATQHFILLFYNKPNITLFLMPLSASTLQGWMKLPLCCWRGSAPPHHSHLPSTPKPRATPPPSHCITWSSLPTQTAQRVLRYGVRNGRSPSLGDPNANCSAQPSSPQTANVIHLYQRKKTTNRSSMEQSHSPLMYIHGGKSHFNY